jgi:ligand-binding sensor domain-containing protein/signal transduction histidine kinase
MVGPSEVRVQLCRRAIRQSVLRLRGYIFAVALQQIFLGTVLPPLTHAQIADPNVAPHSHTGPRPVRLSVIDGNDIRFSRLSTAQGLSQTRVAGIVQDNQGFMWLGTQNGLDRYDGYEYKVFTHDPARENSLSCGFIHSIFKDHSGTLWVGCDHFLDRFDNVTETFTHYHLGADAPGVASNFVNQMSQDRTGLLWLATGNGLFRLNPDTGQIVHYVHDPLNPFSLSNDQVKSTLEDSSGRFWVVDGDDLEEFDRTNGRVTLRNRLDKGVGFSASLCEDHLGVLWITYIAGGHGSGLAVFDRSSRRLIPYSLYDKASGKRIYGGFMAAIEDHKNTLWFASFGAGLLKFDREHQVFIRYRNHPSDLESLAENRVISLCEDREGNIWAGLHAKEPNLFRTEVAQFMPLSRNQNNPNSLGETFVNAVYQDHAGVLWTGTTGALNRIDSRSGQSVSYPPPGSGFSNDIIAINEDTSGTLWVGTYGAGLSRFDPKTGRYKTFLHRPGDPSSLSSNIVSRLLVDHEGTMWIATYNGLDRFNTKDESLVTYKQYKNSDEEQYLNIAEDQTGSLWIGSVGGVNRFDPKTGQFTVYAHKVGDPGSLSDDIVLSVYVDHSGAIWVGTENGLNKLNAENGAFTHYFVKDGLPSNEVSCVLGDESGMLWMSTNRGLSKLDPIANKFTNYSTVDGLPGNDLTGWDACFKNRSGEMFFGGFSGGVAFFPKNVTSTSYPLTLVLTEFKLGGRGVEVGPHSPLPKSISYADNLTLSHDQTIFSLRFAALTYYNPAANKYRYRLEGLDNDWIEVGSDSRVATFSTLPVGKYTFRVQTATRHGAWSEPGLALTINSLPPWWATLWFRSVCVVTAVAIIWMFYRLRLKQVAAGIRARMEARLGERERIARDLHDTLLQSVQALILMFHTASRRIPDWEPVRQDMERALGFADQVLMEGRDQVRSLRTSPVPTGELQTAFQQVAEELSFDRNSTFKAIVEGSVRELHPIIREESYSVGREAIINAVRHSEGRNIEIEIIYDSQEFRLRIRDDGRGIDPDVLKKGGRDDHWGLQGMRERAARVGGHLNVWSRPGSGTEVELTVPAATAYRSPRIRPQDYSHD